MAAKHATRAHTKVVSWWEGELDHDKLLANLNKTIDPTDVETALTTG